MTMLFCAGDHAVHTRLALLDGDEALALTAEAA
jgi:hypothetical protein